MLLICQANQICVRFNNNNNQLLFGGFSNGTALLLLQRRQIVSIDSKLCGNFFPIHSSMKCYASNSSTASRHSQHRIESEFRTDLFALICSNNRLGRHRPISMPHTKWQTMRCCLAPVPVEQQYLMNRVTFASDRESIMQFGPPNGNYLQIVIKCRLWPMQRNDTQWRVPRERSNDAIHHNTVSMQCKKPWKNVDHNFGR